MQPPMMPLSGRMVRSMNMAMEEGELEQPFDTPLPSAPLSHLLFHFTEKPEIHKEKGSSQGTPVVSQQQQTKASGNQAKGGSSGGGGAWGRREAHRPALEFG